MRRVKPVRSSTLQLDEHLHFQQLLFVVRCIGALLLVVGLLAALAGAFGASGPLAEARAQAGAATADYPRFARYQAPARMDFGIATAAVGGETFELVLEGEHARDFHIEQVLPEPQEVAVADDRIRYTFAVEPGRRQHVTIAGQAEAIGTLSGTATVAGEPPMRIDSFVYP